MASIKTVFDPSFKRYGAVVSGIELGDIIAAAREIDMPPAGVAYERSLAALERTGSFARLQVLYAGGQTIVGGLCWGHNDQMNAVEYHRSNEANIAVTDLVVMLGDRRDIRNQTYDSGLLELFYVPAGTMIELFATTLHFAPCQCSPEGFRSIVLLPGYTNMPLPAGALELARQAGGESSLLAACDKWLIAHPDSDKAKEGHAFPGITGENIRYVPGLS